MRFTFAFLLVFAIYAQGRDVFAQEINAQIDLEGRVFSDEALFDEQHGANGSVAFEAEAFWQSNDRRHEIIITPFFRLDSGDPERTSVDLREGYWLFVARNWELRAGFATMFWGVTESQHLVDIINQTDQADRPDGEAKLGQPMVHFTYVSRAGDFQFIGMPFFRERTYPGLDGRLRFPLAVESSRKLHSDRVDLAVRWSRPVRWFDVGLSHFWGTSREPVFAIVATDSVSAPEVVANYDIIHQTGIDVQSTFRGWLLKWEAISRSGQGDRFFSTVAGFEYTFSNLKNSGIDVGTLVEYHYDSRDDIQFGPQMISPTPFNKDVFVGSRLAVNDVKSTELLIGGIVDVETGGVAGFLEGARRIGNSLKLTAEIRTFLNTDEKDLLYNFRNDSYGQVTLSYYFDVGK